FLPDSPAPFTSEGEEHDGNNFSKLSNGVVHLLRCAQIFRREQSKSLYVIVCGHNGYRFLGGNVLNNCILKSKGSGANRFHSPTGSSTTNCHVHPHLARKINGSSVMRRSHYGCFVPLTDFEKVRIKHVGPALSPYGRGVVRGKWLYISGR